MASFSHAEAYREALVWAMAEHPYRKQVHVYTVAEYARMRLWLTPDTMGGCAVTEDGDLVSVFRHPRGDTISSILRDASEEAKTLDCFDTDMFLPDLYTGYGFVHVSTVKFDPKQAPDGWDIETDGAPNVALMLHRRLVVNNMPETPIFCISWTFAEYVREYIMGNNRGELLRM